MFCFSHSTKSGLLNMQFLTDYFCLLVNFWHLYVTGVWHEEFKENGTSESEFENL